MAITSDEARMVLARWQPIPRLADWDIDLRIVTGPTPLSFGSLRDEVDREVGPVRSTRPAGARAAGEVRDSDGFRAGVGRRRGRRARADVAVSAGAAA